MRLFVRLKPFDNATCLREEGPGSHLSRFLIEGAPGLQVFSSIFISSKYPQSHVERSLFFFNNQLKELK